MALGVLAPAARTTSASNTSWFSPAVDATSSTVSRSTRVCSDGSASQSNVATTLSPTSARPSHAAGTIGPMPPLELVSPFTAAGDQPEAIEALSTGVERGDRYQTLLGITGSGKSFTIAGAIARAQRPTLILAPNKSLAAQLASEFREFFPKNRVEYFVSYYDYYQPEAYVP